MSLYQELSKLGLPMDSHESDLYVKWSPEAAALVRATGRVFQSFRHQVTGERWLEVPFAYEPWWKNRGF